MCRVARNNNNTLRLIGGRRYAQRYDGREERRKYENDHMIPHGIPMDGMTVK